MTGQRTPASSRQTIVIVDDNVTTLKIARNTLHGHYETYALPSGTVLFNLLEKITPDLILLDIEMPEISGYEAIRKLKADERLSEIPVIFVTSRYDEGSELEGLSLGAIDYITKPFSPALLLRRIKNHLLIAAQEKELKSFNSNLMQKVDQKAKQIIQMQFAILNVVAELVEFRDRKTGGHIARTQQYLDLLVKKMLKNGVYLEEISSWDLTFLIPSAQLHDVGKIAISDTILNKPGKLTPEEFEIMKTHATRGVDAIERIEHETHEDSFLYHAKRFAGYHHEKWDGSGYPHGLSGKDIPLQGRLMAIADVYDALISARPYKEEMPLDMARSIILDGNGKHFDPMLIDVFRDVADGFEEIATTSRNQGDSFIFKWAGSA
ncbi:MAG: response regulator [Betaproteobacteria bacterium]|jgi:putative two-component system response regulator|nr:response regulator [Betaproteobacteria bacterium]